MSSEINSFEFGDFLLDTKEKVLLRQGKLLSITPKVFQLLLVLVENHGRIVEKSRLMETVWADSFVEESNLTFTMRQLRKTLGDDKNNPQFIETIPKRGYRFIAETKENNGQTDVFPDVPAENSLSAAKYSLHQKNKPPAAAEPARNYALWSSVILVLAFGFTTYYWWFGAKKTPSDGQLKFQRLTSNGSAKLGAVSPDGKFIAYILDKNEQQSLWIKNIAAGSELQLLAPAENIPLGSLTFSPDGNNIYYAANRRLYHLSVLGGTPKKVLENYGGTSQNNAVSFSPDGKQFAFIRYSSEGEESAAVIIANTDGSGERILATSKRPDIFLRSAAWSPDGKVIACAAMRPGGGQTVKAVRVEDGAVSSFAASWSFVLQVIWHPNGDRLFVLASEGGNSIVSQIWRLPSPDGEARSLINDFNNYQSISLTEDGRALAAVRLEQTAHIWVMPGDETNQAKQLTGGFGKYEGNYSLNWLPGGRLIYGTVMTGKGEYWTIDADGQSAKLLSPDAGSDGVTPDGKYLVFQSGDGEGSGLFRFDTENGERKQLTKGTDVWASVSPDGKWVVFTRYGNRVALWKVSIEGGDAVQLTNIDGFPLAPAVSPDSKMIAFYWSKNGAPSKIALVPMEGGEITKTFDIQTQVSQGYGKTAVQWTADGQAVNYLAIHDGVSNIWRQPIDGSAPLQVTNFQDGRIFNFAYSPDGTKLALSKGTFERDVILVTNLPD